MDPKALQSRPKLYDWMAPYIQAFKLLDSRRPIGFGEGAIPLSDIVAYLQVFEAPETPQQFVSRIVKMDNAYLEVKAKKAAAKSATNSKPSSQK